MLENSLGSLVEGTLAFTGVKESYMALPKGTSDDAIIMFRVGKRLQVGPVVHFVPGVGAVGGIPHVVSSSHDGRTFPVSLPPLPPERMGVPCSPGTDPDTLGNAATDRRPSLCAASS